MKVFKILYLLLTVLFSEHVVSQNDKNISVISAEKLNVVYRGVPNPLRILYPGADSIVVNAPGLKKTDIASNYILSPGPSNEVTIYVTAFMPDGSRKSERKIFRIKGLPSPEGLINGDNCGNCLVQMSKSQFATAVISVHMRNFLMIDFTTDYWKTSRFSVKIKDKEYNVQGNMFPKEVVEIINRLKIGTTILIHDIHTKGDEESIGHLKRIAPIKIMIVEEAM